MKRFPVSIAVMLLVQFLSQTGAGASAVVDRVVAVVNNEVITLSDLQREMTTRKAEGKQDERMVLEDMIDRKIQMAAAKREGMDVTDKELSEAIGDIMKRNRFDEKQFEAALSREGISLDQYKNELREQMTISRLFNKFVKSGIAVDEAEVRKYYERNAGSYTRAEEIRVRQIFFPLAEKSTPDQDAAVRAKAEAAAARAKKGEDFVRLVKELDSENAATGGDMGFMQRDEAVAEIQEATKDLKVGGIAGPIRFAGGYHVIKLEEIRKPREPYEKVKDEITKMLYSQKMESTYRTWLQTLRSDANIENKL